MKTETAVQDELLYSLWQRSQPGNDNPDVQGNEVWERAIMLVEQLGRGMEETVRYLYAERPAFPQFVVWVKANATAEKEEERLEQDVLTAEDIDFWNANGYLVLRNAVTQEQAADAATAIWQHLGASQADPQTWYKGHEDLRGLMLTFYHHPALEANRRSPRIRRAYEQLYGTEDIHRNRDKVSFNPPENGSYHFLGSSLHWDVSLQLPIPFRLQGLLYLTDTHADNGAFHCVPGFHNAIGNWMDNLPVNADPRAEALKTLQPIPVTGNAGDFVIWHQALPHCATPNRGATPRLVQYFTYLRPDVSSQEVWK
jgi:ectoine hydroxylase-related dioxygenase (phytanoyl-CoA dioxygenase family)